MRHHWSRARWDGAGVAVWYAAVVADAISSSAALFSCSSVPLAANHDVAFAIGGDSLWMVMTGRPRFGRCRMLEVKTVGGASRPRPGVQAFGQKLVAVTLATTELVQEVPLEGIDAFKDLRQADGEGLSI